jgi:hypothetical protein
MKPLWIALALCLSTSARAAPDDIQLQTRITRTSMAWLIEKTLLILNNAEIDDGLTGTTTIEDEILTLDEVTSDPAVEKVRTLVASVFRVDAAKAVLRIRIPKLSYQVHSLRASATRLDVEDPVMNLDAAAQIRGVDIGLPEGVQVDLMIPDPKTGGLNRFLSASLAPSKVRVPNTLEPAEFEVSLQAIREESLRFNLTGYRLDHLPRYVERHVNEIETSTLATGGPITADQIKVDPVYVRVNQLGRTIDFDIFKPLIQKKMKAILTTIILEVGKSLRTSIGPSILRSIFKESIPSTLAISTAPFYTSFKVRNFQQPRRDQFQLGVEGGLCTLEMYRRFGIRCVQETPVPAPVRVIGPEVRRAAQEELSTMLASGKADVVASVSEEFINRLVKTAIESKLWDEMLAEDHLRLGEKGAFVILNKQGQAPELYLDLIYSGKGGFEGIFINARRPIRFPLRIGTRLSFPLENGIPKLVITTEGVLSDAQQIIKGIPEYGLPSKLVCGLKKKIARMILRMSKKLEGRNMVELPLPIFKGIGLEKTWLESSQHGRMNIYFKI